MAIYQLTPQEEQMLRAQQGDIERLRGEITRFKQAGLDTTIAEAQLMRLVKVNSGLLQQFGTQARQTT